MAGLCLSDDENSVSSNSNISNLMNLHLNQNKEVTLSQSWHLRTCCLSDCKAMTAPQRVHLLYAAGLGNKEFLVKNYSDVSDEAFRLMLLKEYPKLNDAGGFKFFYCSYGKFTTITEPWTPTNIHAQVGGSKRRLFIRPNKNIKINYAELKFKESQMKKLAYSNPGAKSRFLEDFDPERSGREMRKMKRKMYCDKPRKAALYNEYGLLLNDHRDLCDCCERSCPGCHFPCPKCTSAKCGQDCRSNRKYTYAQVEVEGTNKTVQFVDTSMGMR